MLNFAVLDSIFVENLFSIIVEQRLFFIQERGVEEGDGVWIFSSRAPQNAGLNREVDRVSFPVNFPLSLPFHGCFAVFASPGGPVGPTRAAGWKGIGVRTV